MIIFNEDYPTYLLYNPNDKTESVIYTPNGTNVDLYNLVTDEIIKSNVSTNTNISIPSKDAVVIMEIPTNSTLTRDDKTINLGTTLINRYQATINIFKS